MVALEVQESGCGEAWWGGVAVQLPASTLGKDAQRALLDVCAAQVQVQRLALAWLVARDGSAAVAVESGPGAMESGPSSGSSSTSSSADAAGSSSTADGDASSIELCVRSALRCAFPQRCGSGGTTVVDPRVLAAARDALRERLRGNLKAESDVLGGEEEAPALPADAQLWFVRKLFDLEQPLRARVGKNDKTRAKMFVCAASADGTFAPPDAVAVATASAPLAKLFAELSSNPEQAQEAQSGGNAKPEEPSAKRQRRYVPDFSSVLAADPNPVAQLEADGGWSLPADCLRKLDGSERIQKQLRDDRLVRVLLDIDKAKDGFSALQQRLDCDADFAGFVDLVLETIGAQRTSKRPDGSHAIESCLHEVLHSLRPGFLSGVKEDVVATLAKNDDDEDVDDVDKTVTVAATTTATVTVGENGTDTLAPAHAPSSASFPAPAPSAPPVSSAAPVPPAIVASLTEQ